MSLENLIMPGLETRWVEGLLAETYHSDKTTVSSTGLRKIFKSPATFKAHFERPMFEPTEAMEFGSMAHVRILEGPSFLERYAVMPDLTEGIRTKKGELSKNPKSTEEYDARVQKWRSENKGKIECTQDQMDRMSMMIESILSHPDGPLILKNGITEVSGYYTDEETGLRLRIRPDFLNLDMMAFVDLKTTKDISRQPFENSIVNFGYDFQMAMYGAGIEAITGKPVDFYTFLAIESQPPFECAIYTCDDAVLDRGRKQYRKALRLLRESIDKNHFPRYQQCIETISLPNWAI